MTSRSLHQDLDPLKEIIAQLFYLSQVEKKYQLTCNNHTLSNQQSPTRNLQWLLENDIVVQFSHTDWTSHQKRFCTYCQSGIASTSWSRQLWRWRSLRCIRRCLLYKSKRHWRTKGGGGETSVMCAFTLVWRRRTPSSKAPLVREPPYQRLFISLQATAGIASGDQCVESLSRCLWWREQVVGYVYVN